MNQCAAQTLPSVYSKAHRCLKITGLKKVGTRCFCRHHQTMRARKAALAAGGHKP